MSLKQKTIKGLFWSGASQAGKQISQFIITAILARLLSPNDFGLLAMATVFINFGMIFSEMGISSALIQKQDTHDRHFYSAFWLNVVVGVVLTLIFIAISPLIAWFYKKPELQIILTVISVNYFISSFVVIQQTILTKEMDFKSLAIRDIIAIILSGGVGIFMAYHGFGVWSLVFQSVVFTLSNAILLWTLSSWRPKFQFAKSDIKDIFKFGANITGFNIVNYFARNIDQLLIGKFLGSQALGYYSLAYKILLYPLQFMSGVIVRVVFPAFSKLQNNIDKLRISYMKMIKFLSLITFPMIFVLYGISTEFILTIFGSKWAPVITLFKIFAFCGPFQSLITVNGTIYLSIGRSDVQFRMQLIGTLVTTICVIFGLQYGVVGVAFAYTIQSILYLQYALFVSRSMICLKSKDFYSLLKAPLLISSIIIILLYIYKIIFSHFSYPQIVYTSLPLCLIAYIVLLFVFKEIGVKNNRIKIQLIESY